MATFAVFSGYAKQPNRDGNFDGVCFTAILKKMGAVDITKNPKSDPQEND